VRITKIVQRKIQQSKKNESSPSIFFSFCPSASTTSANIAATTAANLAATTAANLAATTAANLADTQQPI
jgi:hypothetical protein